MTNEHMAAWALLAEENVALKAAVADHRNAEHIAVERQCALERELARLRTALESAKADRQRAVDDLFAQLRVNESLRAESMRGAVCWHCKVCLVVERPVCERCPAECDDEDCQAEGCEEQQAASQPLENIEGLAP